MAILRRQPWYRFTIPSYPTYTGPLVAGGVVYCGFGGRSAYDPEPIGAKLYALNATTGDELWNISGRMDPVAIADGYLVTLN
jgi:outer membrane protein assembly factor BamB